MTDVKNKLADNNSIKKVVSRLTNKHIDPLDDFGPTDTIVKLQDALDLRIDELDYERNPRQYKMDKNNSNYWDLIDELKDDINNLRDWKRKGVQWIYIDDDIYTFNGKCCLVHENNLENENNWITDYLRKHA